MKFEAADYFSALDAVYCAIIVVDCEGKICFKNASSYRLVKETGFSHSQIVSRFNQQIDVGQGKGRFTLQNRNRWIICHVYPWIRGMRRLGSILVLHESGHETCSQQEVDWVNIINREINAVIETSTNGIIVTDEQGIISRINAAIEKLFNVQRRNILGHSVSEFSQNQQIPEEIVDQVLKEGKTITLASDYNEKKLIFTGTPITDEKGKLTSAVVTIQDISAILDLRRRLEEQKLKLDDYTQQLARMQPPQADSVIANSSQMKKILAQIKIIAPLDSTVLITGESGTGKEIIANEIYKQSSRQGKPFIKINCGAIPDSLFESELFGYTSGSFTGAKKQGKTGFFKLADKGTLLLDEVGELSLAAQVKLLRVIQEKQVLPLGADKPEPVDVRLLAATNRDLWQMVEAGKFRQDLYYRLHVIHLEIPPLRERPEDIIQLSQLFLAKFNQKYKQKKNFSLELARLLLSQPWSGNIRELENVLETMVILSPGDVLLPKDFPGEQDPESQEDQTGVHVQGILPWRQALAETERQLLRQARKKYKTTREIAKALGVNQSTVSRKLKEYQLV